MSAFYSPFPNISGTTNFYRNNPGWRCCNEFGQTINFMSYAYPGVQERILNFMDELFEYQPDGICFAFNRGLPLMLYEAPVIEAYRRRHGRAPKLPEEADSIELQVVRHELLADFVEKARQICEKHGAVLSAIVPRDFARNRLYGLDADILAERGLVESIMVGAGHGDNPALNDDLEPLKALKALGKKGGTTIYGGGSNAVHGMGWVNGDLKARAQRMASYLDICLDGGWFWDAEYVIGSEWEAMRCFGDRKILQQIIDGRWPPDPTYKTKALNDMIVSRYNPHHAY